MSDTALLLPSDVLHDETHRAVSLPVCDHYCGVEKRIRKALALQREMLDEYGEALFDVTLDCEDGAPAGAEAAHAAMVVELAREALQTDARARIAVRIHPADHPAHASDIATIATPRASIRINGRRSIWKPVGATYTAVLVNTIVTFPFVLAASK